jgi:hypothetical protein
MRAADKLMKQENVKESRPGAMAPKEPINGQNFTFILTIPI